MSLHFEDLHEHDAGYGYECPNECWLTWRELIKRIPVYKAAGICSGGEVGLFAMLPLVRDELVLVDHSYHSLSYAATKYLLLRDRGWAEARRLLREGGPELKAAVEAAQADLPEPLKKEWARYRCNLDYNNIKREWEKAKTPVLRKAVQKFAKVSFLHGDLADLAERGPFGLLYLSNALGHVGRNGGGLALLSLVEKALRPGSYVIATGCTDLDKRWQRVASQRATMWDHVLYRVPVTA